MASQGSAPANNGSITGALMEGLVRLYVSNEGIATVTLNDPINLNSLSATLIAELRVQLNEVHRLIGTGNVQGVIVHANGPNFCVGGGAAADGCSQWPTIVNQVTLYPNMCGDVQKIMKSRHSFPVLNDTGGCCQQCRKCHLLARRAHDCNLARQSYRRVKT